MPGSHPKKRKLYGMLLRMVFQSNFSQTILNQQAKNLLIYQRKYDRLYHVKVISYFYARVAQGWSTTLPRWGPRVRIPSRAFFIAFRCISCILKYYTNTIPPSRQERSPLTSRPCVHFLNSIHSNRHFLRAARIIKIHGSPFGFISSVLRY